MENRIQLREMCEFCEGRLVSPPYVLYDNVNYERYEFCSLKCLRSWVLRE